MFLGICLELRLGQCFDIDTCAWLCLLSETHRLNGAIEDLFDDLFGVFGRALEPGALPRESQVCFGLVVLLVFSKILIAHQVSPGWLKEKLLVTIVSLAAQKFLKRL